MLGLRIRDQNQKHSQMKSFKNIQATLSLTRERLDEELTAVIYLLELFVTTSLWTVSWQTTLCEYMKRLWTNKFVSRRKSTPTISRSVWNVWEELSVWKLEAKWLFGTSDCVKGRLSCCLYLIGLCMLRSAVIMLDWSLLPVCEWDWQ